MNLGGPANRLRDPVPFRPKALTAGWFAPARFQLWWLDKTPILFGILYLVAVVTRVPLHGILPLLGRLVAAIAPVGCFACVINELCDVEEDRSAGKANALAGSSLRFRWAWLLASGTAVLLGLGLLRDHPLAMGLYGANVVVFLLYSLPPVRLKTRGMWGVLADACGALVLPGLWICVLVGLQGELPLPLPVLLALLAWTTGLGVRSILSHQAADLDNDRRSGTATLGHRLGREGLERLGRWVAMPLELCGLPVLLWAGGGWLPLGIALTFVVGQVALARQRGMRLHLVDGQPGSLLLLFDFYVTLFPLVFLPRLLQESPWAWLIVPFHLVLFAPNWTSKKLKGIVGLGE